MEHFNSDALGYNKSEVNEFVDYVIKKLKKISTQLKVS